MGYGDYDGFDDDDNQSNQGPKALRDALRAANKRLAELEEQNKTLSGQVSSRNLKDALEAKGLRQGLARVIAKEDVDITDEKALEAWLSDPANQEDFGFSLEGTNAETDGGEGAGSEEEAGGEYAEQYARMQGAEQGAIPADRIKEARTQLASAKTPEDLQAAIDRAVKG